MLVKNHEISKLENIGQGHWMAEVSCFSHPNVDKLQCNGKDNYANNLSYNY